MSSGFIVRSVRTGECYCGKCGKRLIDDSYNRSKHAELCGFAVGSEMPLREGIDLGYRLEGTDEGVTLSVCRPRLKPIRGFSDRFYGVEWDTLCETRFNAGTRIPAVTKNETGMEENRLLDLIKEGHIIPISPERDSEEIHKVFPGVIDLYSLQMFDHIYRNKGFRSERVLTKEAEAKLLRKLPGEKEREKLARIQEESAQYEAGTATGKVPILGNLYRYRGEHYILHLVLYEKGELTVLLFSKNYCACSRKVSVKELLRKEYCLVGSTRSVIRRFDEIYPEYHLAQYAGMSENILYPLLAADYHVGIELAAKSCVPSIAENYEVLSEMKRAPALYGNLKKMFGLPISVLRTVSREQACDAVLERMKSIYAYNPVFLQFDEYTASMIEFYMCAAIDRVPMRNGVEGIRNLSDRQILQILRYLRKHPEEGHYYCDYLRACARLGEYLFGLAPDIPIREAHDRTVARIEITRDIRIREGFAKAVSSKAYRDLATCFTQEDEERYADDPFVVTIPTECEDLFIESSNMHNCVRIYVGRVSDKSTRIYFLRKKDNPDKSYGTLEVSDDGKELWQAKAFANGRLPMYAQRFIVKWCRAKGIRIKTWDISNQAQKGA